MFTAKNKLNFNKKNLKNNWGHYIVHQNLKFNIEDIDKNFLTSFPSYFECIGFNEYIKKLIQDARKNADDIGSFVAIHIRGGDLIFDKHCRNIAIANFKGTPIEIAWDIIEKNINDGNKVVLFGQNLEELELLQQESFNLNKNAQVLLSCEFLKDLNLDSMQTAIYEIILLSCAKKIYSADSGFARLASIIGHGKEPEKWFKVDSKFDSGDMQLTNIAINGMTLQDFDEFFKQKEVYETIKKHFGKFTKITALRRSFSLFFLYCFSRVLEEDKSYNYLSKALELDNENIFYNIANIYHIIKKGNFAQADNIIKDIIQKDEEAFFFIIY